MTDRASLLTGVEPLLVVNDLRVHFPKRHGLIRRTTEWIRAVDGVTLQVRGGETLGVVGESGSGKTTVGRAIVRLNNPQSGEIRLGGLDLVGLRGGALREQRRHLQMVFQDPYSSLDPRQKVHEILAEPMRIHGLASGGALRNRVMELLSLVGLEEAHANRYPSQFSGGQRQRIGIARALAIEPELIVCDEPVSALDVSIQAQIVNLLEKLQQRLGLAYIFIAHDLAIVRHIADRIAVMYLGRVVESADCDELFAAPRHPYTVALLSAVPVPDAAAERSRRRIILTGDPPSPASPPSGCHFHSRCWLREQLGRPDICAQLPPVLRASGPDPSGSHVAACHFESDVTAYRPSTTQ